MEVSYDDYYQSPNLFGEPYPALISFFAQFQDKGKVLDLGCGQGRDAIALAKLGFEVLGIDHSKVGIEQLNQIAISEKLSLEGKVADIYEFSDFFNFDFILLDSIFHFGKKEKEKEIAFLRKIVQEAKVNAIICICIQKIGKKVQILDQALTAFRIEEIYRKELWYEFVDQASKHRSKTRYEIISIKKLFLENTDL